MNSDIVLKAIVLIALSSFTPLSLANPVPPRGAIKVFPSDAANGDQFGFSVALNSSLALAGAPFQDNSRGGNAGASYLFDARTGVQLRKFLGADTSSNDEFGFSVGIDESKAIISAPGDADRGSSSGSAYVFDTATGNQLFKLTPTDGAAGDSFGYSVAISGDTLIVGAVADDDGADAAGSAYLFNATNGRELTKLIASDPGVLDNFGYSVAISNNKALVGAPFKDGSSRRFDSGAAYVFDVDTGEELVKLNASDSSFNDNFGLSVALDGNIAIIGSPFSVTSGGQSGSAYIFDVNSGAQLHKLTPSDAASGDVFGKSVAIWGNFAIVGARGDDTVGTDVGSAYIFDIRTGAELFKLTAFDGAEDDEFGGGVAIGEHAIFIAAPFDDDAGDVSGSAYLFANPIPEPHSLAMMGMIATILGIGFHRFRL
jgi:WD40 repeat protein